MSKTVLFKNVKVYPKYPINLNKDLKIARAMESPMEMSVGNIQRCMLLGARVFEVLEDGTEVMLYNNNYNKDNSELQESLKNKVAEEIPTPEVAKQPVNTGKVDINVNAGKTSVPDTKQPVNTGKADTNVDTAAKTTVDTKVDNNAAKTTNVEDKTAVDSAKK